MDHGKAIEAVFEDAISRSFLADFVSRSPKYSRSGQEKEAADLLVLFKDTVVVFQLKSREVDVIEGEISDAELGRVERAIQKAFSQLKAFPDAVRLNQLTEFENILGHTLPLSMKSISRVHFVVVGAFFADDPEFGPLRIQIPLSVTEPDEVVHYFDLNDFLYLLIQIDSLPDFFLFLDTRSFLLANGSISNWTSPLDIWMAMQFRRADILDALKNSKPISIDGCTGDHIEDVQRLEELEKPSYLIDDFIKILRAGIGITSGRLSESVLFKENLGIPLATPGSLDSYQRICPLLASLSRGDRIHLADQILIRVERLSTQDISFGAVKFQEDDKLVYVFLATNDLSESNRHLALFNLCHAIAARTGASEAVGLSVLSIEDSVVPCECIYVDIQDSNPCKKLVDWSNENLSIFEIDNDFL